MTAFAGDKTDAEFRPAIRRGHGDDAGVVHPVATARRRSPRRSTAIGDRDVSSRHGQDARSFRNDVQPVLAKMGCSTGACHGALAGKGGFKLSLRGYDAMADYLAITRDARGRRIEPTDPGRSLLLAQADDGGAAQGRAAVRRRFAGLRNPVAMDCRGRHAAARR